MLATDRQRKLPNAENENTAPGAPPSSDVFGSLIVAACSLTSATGGAIAIRDAQGILCRASTGNAPPVGSRLDENSGFTRECFESGSIVVCRDAENDARVQPAAARSLHLRSAVAVPIQRQDSVLGIVEVFSSRPDAFDITHIAELQRIAHSLVAILDRAQSTKGERPPELPIATAPPSVDSAQAGRMQEASAATILTADPAKKKIDSRQWMAIAGAVGISFLISLLLVFFLDSASYRRLKAHSLGAMKSAPSSTARQPARSRGDGLGSRQALDEPVDQARDNALDVEVRPKRSASGSMGRNNDKSGAASPRKPPANPVELASEHSADNAVRPPPLTRKPKQSAKSGVGKGFSPGPPVPAIQDAPQAGRTSPVAAKLDPLNPPIVQAPLAEAARAEAALAEPAKAPSLSLPATITPATITPAAITPATIAPALRPLEFATLEFTLSRTFDAHSGWVSSIAFSADGQRLVSGGWDETVKSWEVPTGEKLSTVARKINGVGAITFSRDGRWLAAENSNYAVTLWDGATGQLVRTLPGNRPSGLGNNWIYSIAFSPDGRLLASGVDNKTIRIWDVATGHTVRDLTASPRSVIYIAFSPDGRWLASGEGNNTIEIWDVATGRQLRALSGHKKQVYAVAFSPDGRLLASASGDKTVKLWNAATGVELRTLSGHRNWVTSVAFSPDGRWLASGSWDNTIKIWNVETGREIQTLSGQNHHIYTVAFAPDGHWLASGREDGKIEFWRVERTVNRAEVENKGDREATK